MVEGADGTPDRFHNFPLLSKAPQPDFLTWATAPQRRRQNHGPLFDAPSALLAVVEGCQPYQGGDRELLGVLHRWWNTDKHRTLLPTFAFGARPALEFRDVEIINRSDYYEGETYVVEVGVSNIGPDPHVDVQADAPFDIAISEGGRVIKPIGVLLECTHLILCDVLSPLGLSA